MHLQYFSNVFAMQKFYRSAIKAPLKYCKCMRSHTFTYILRGPTNPVSQENEALMRLGRIISDSSSISASED